MAFPADTTVRRQNAKSKRPRKMVPLSKLTMMRRANRRSKLAAVSKARRKIQLARFRRAEREETNWL